jgi:phage shock protein C
MREKRLARRPEDGMIAGVAAGVAQTYGIDVTLVRLAFVGLVVISAGIALPAYLIAALVMPRDDDEPGIESIRHGVDDLVSKGKELYGETKKAIDRTPSRNGGSQETDGAEPATPASTMGSDRESNR